MLFSMTLDLMWSNGLNFLKIPGNWKTWGINFLLRQDNAFYCLQHKNDADMLRQVFSRTPGETLYPRVFSATPDKKEPTAGEIGRIHVKTGLRKPAIPK